MLTDLLKLQAPDLSAPEEFFLMQDIARYLHEDRDALHHPTEDLSFDRLVRCKPDTEKDVARLRRDHDELSEDAIETGIAEMIEMLQRHTESLLQDSRDTVHKTFNSDGLRPALATQASFMGFVGKKGISVACDAAGIYLRAIKNATGPLWNIRS